MREDVKPALIQPEERVLVHPGPAHWMKRVPILGGDRVRRSKLERLIPCSAFGETNHGASVVGRVATAVSLEGQVDGSVRHEVRGWISVTVAKIG